MPAPRINTPEKLQAAIQRCVAKKDAAALLGLELALTNPYPDRESAVSSIQDHAAHWFAGAAFDGNEEEMTRLLRAGLDPFAPRTRLPQGLFLASLTRSWTVAACLIERWSREEGFPVSMVKEGIDIATELFFQWPNHSVSNAPLTALHLAAFHDMKAFVDQVASRGGNLEVQMGNGGWTPLFLGLHYNSLETALLLVDQGAKTEIFVTEMLATTGFSGREVIGSPDGASLVKKRGRPKKDVRLGWDLSLEDVLSQKTRNPRATDATSARWRQAAVAFPAILERRALETAIGETSPVSAAVKFRRL
jgi:hypothetical protein